MANEHPQGPSSEGHLGRTHSSRDASDHRAGGPRRPHSPAAGTGSSGWWAAAACLILAIAAWIRPLHAPPRPRVAPAEAPAIARRALLAEAGTIELALDPTKDPAAGALHGDVVWDPVAQRGFIRVAGLPRNDPKSRQYQIWIFDATRDPRYPVDGGVFDSLSPARELIVPIQAAVPVRRAKAFAITLEKAGGVVVSAQRHVLALAEAG
ncbi:MAG TPA: anti-sigma factor [Steroidobacteraceae bacterium]|nr:anti-sigma factor [Steroidobacteraceae bacterium]